MKYIRYAGRLYRQAAKGIPSTQYHATSWDRVDSIMRKGLLPPRGEQDVSTLVHAIPTISTADKPTDARSACIVAVTGGDDAKELVASCRQLGSPVVFVLHPQGVDFQVWRQTRSGSECIDSVPSSQASAYFRTHKDELSPNANYRAKTWGKFEERQTQLHFVDAGLMPAIEIDMGERLRLLIERIVHKLRRDTLPKSKDITATIAPPRAQTWGRWRCSRLIPAPRGSSAGYGVTRT